MADQQINIALSGDVGTGTTTLGRNLASTLGWRHVNAGEYFRAWHRERGIPLEQTQQIPESLDRELDERFARDMATQVEVVFESHLAGWLAKGLHQSLKILCTADRSVAMERIAQREGWSIKEATKYSMLRTTRLNEKFQHLYGVTNPYDPQWFDVVLDTTHLSAGQVLDLALRHVLIRWPDGHKLAAVLNISLS
jgi:cytidylate kinase